MVAVDALPERELVLNVEFGSVKLDLQQRFTLPTSGLVL